MKWTHNNIPDQTDKIVIVTGANTGIGFETAKVLAQRGAVVTLACRSQEKGEAAAERIMAERPKGRATYAPLDLSDLESVRAFAASFVATNDRLDLLINNAGVMIPPESKTAQGFELQFGVNHLGHFALTGHLIDLLGRTPGARVVTVSSIAHRHGAMDFEDLNFTARGYKPARAYGQSKLANLLFTRALHRRLTEAGIDVKAVAAHPGWTGTDLQRHSLLIRAMNLIFAMKTEQGALPTLRAATDPDVAGNDYYGPHRMMEMNGYPVRVDCTDAAKRDADAERLWDVSELLTGVSPTIQSMSTVA